MNLMAYPIDKSLKFLTATVQSVLKWKQHEDKVTSIYEVFGENFTSFTSLDFPLSSLLWPECVNLLLLEKVDYSFNFYNEQMYP